MKKILFVTILTVASAGCWFSGSDCAKTCGDKGVLLCDMNHVVCNQIRPAQSAASVVDSK